MLLFCCVVGVVVVVHAQRPLSANTTTLTATTTMRPSFRGGSNALDRNDGRDNSRLPAANSFGRVHPPQPAVPGYGGAQHQSSSASIGSAMPSSSGGLGGIAALGSLAAASNHSLFGQGVNARKNHRKSDVYMSTGVAVDSPYQPKPHGSGGSSQFQRQLALNIIRQSMSDQKKAMTDRQGDDPASKKVIGAGDPTMMGGGGGRGGGGGGGGVGATDKDDGNDATDDNETRPDPMWTLKTKLHKNVSTYTYL